MKREHVVLVVDDETRIRRLLEVSLKQKGYVVITAVDGDEACAKLDASIDLVITDLKMPGKDGLAVLEEARRRELTMPVIVMTAYGTVDSAVAAMRAGAFDYVTKPFDLDELEILIERAFELDALTSANRFLREAEVHGIEGVIGSSEPMKALFAQIRRVAVTQATVLVLGETGTGKERVARAIHSLSPRCDELFVPVNCAAIPLDLLESELFGHVRGAFTGATENRVGKFELAAGGTLFLDEIGDMPLALQAKMLRVLEEGVVERVGSNRTVHVDVRVISATHRRLEDAVATGTFRDDLYYRLNVIQLRVPPLRERPGDVSLLTAHFLEAAAKQMGRRPLVVDRDAVELLEAYPWPGNVRELRNVCERLAVLCEGESVDVDLVAHLLDLPQPEMPVAEAKDVAADTLSAAVARAEKQAIEAALAKSGGNKAKAARLLAISERNLWYKVKKHRIDGS